MEVLDTKKPLDLSQAVFSHFVRLITLQEQRCQQEQL
jgi:hypothetical protein